MSFSLNLFLSLENYYILVVQIYLIKSLTNFSFPFVHLFNQLYNQVLLIQSVSRDVQILIVDLIAFQASIQDICQ